MFLRERLIENVGTAGYLSLPDRNGPQSIPWLCGNVGIKENKWTAEI